MIEEVINRLMALVPDTLSSVEPAEELEALAKGVAPRNGATFVLPFQDRPEPNSLATGGVEQRIEVLLLVAFVIRRQGDAKGGKRAGSFDTFKDAIEGRLFGWTPSEDNDPFELAAARSAPFGNGVTAYVQTWRTSRYLHTT